MPPELKRQIEPLVDVPDPGSLVTVRQRRWVVEGVKRSGLPPQAVCPKPMNPMNLVHLVSVEDDALGEEFQVIWEVEPGAKLHENLALPEPEDFDPPARLEGFLDAVRWGAVVKADREFLQSPFRSAGKMVVDFVLKHLKKRLFSSPAAFARTLSKHRDTLVNGAKKKRNEVWTLLSASSMKNDIRYTPTDCFETFPFGQGELF